MREKILGISILVFIVIGVVVYQVVQQAQSGNFDIMGGPGEVTTLKGFVGGEKIGFLENPKVQQILRRNYGLQLDYSKAGSIEMVRENLADDIDFLWPSSQVALELYKMEQGNRLVKSDIIFNSPIVMYSWDIVGDALVANGVAQAIPDSQHLTIDTAQMIQIINERKQWSDIGVNQLFGNVSVISTDPTASNSGNMFSGLLANMLNEGEVVNESSIEPLLPQIDEFFARLGYLEHSSGDLFNQYLTTGVGAKPIIVGYENQIVEFALENQDVWPQVKDKVRILYPIPTVWSSHPLIALNEEGSTLIDALVNDEQIRTIAWEDHGFRTGLVGVQNDPSVLAVAGIPERIEQVMPMPDPRVMERIILTLEE
jgi:hypothetical protein